MKLISKIKLQPDDIQKDTLLNTVLAMNDACNFISEVVWEKQVFRQYDIHKLLYYEAKEKFGLGAQATVRCISKVADAYKKDKKRERTFKQQGAVAYDSRLLSYNTEGKYVSIWTKQGRIKIPYTCHSSFAERLKKQKGETDVKVSNGNIYLYVVCEVDNKKQIETDKIIGVDLGIINIASLSDGTIFSGSETSHARIRRKKLREKLQKKGTKSAKRLLKKTSGKEKRFSSNINHIISKQIVGIAKDTTSHIALENLKGIRERRTVRQEQRYIHESWSFYQLKSFITYKAALDGIRVIEVNPKYTSQRCSECGHIAGKNRNGENFLCKECGYKQHADVNGAMNIKVLGAAAVNQPNVVTAFGC